MAVAWVTVIGPRIEQVEYRLVASAGCGTEPAKAAGRDGQTLVDEHAEPQLDYRTDDSTHRLEWIGEGLREFGIEPGTHLDEAGKDAARALMDGCDPRTGEQLVVPKVAVDPRAKLSAKALLDVIADRAEAAGLASPEEVFADAVPRVREHYARLARGVAKKEKWHLASVDVLSRVAAAADVALDDTYGAAAVAEARVHADKRVRTGDRGFDLTLDVPKSYSLLYALADETTAAALREAYLDAVRDTVKAVEGWVGYGMRGHHGGGRVAERVDGTGLLGWIMLHDTARPVGDAAPDPHLHAHVTIAHMVCGVDGQWSTVAGGGRDLHRHTAAAGQYLRARLRQISVKRFGLSWERATKVTATAKSVPSWEVKGIPAAWREAFSKRGVQVEAELKRQTADGDGRKPSNKERAVASAKTRDPKADVPDLRGTWRTEAAEHGDVDGVLHRALPHRPGRVTEPPPVAEIAADLAHPEHGVTAKKKSVHRAAILAAVADALPQGLAGVTELDDLTNAVLAEPGFVRLDRDDPQQLSNPERYTTADLPEIETAILDAARAGLDAEHAVVPATTADAAIEAFELTAGYELSGEQRAVVARLTTAGHALDAVVGVAGAGKTTVMAAARDAWTAAGYRVTGAATAAAAAQHLAAEAGVEAHSVAAWLARINNPNGEGLPEGGVLIVDEAGMVDDRDLARLAEAAQAANTKLVLIGDPRQLTSPGVGSTLTDLHQAVGGLSLTDNRRQQHQAHRDALAAFRAGQHQQALAELAGIGLYTVTSMDDVRRDMLHDWWQARAGHAADGPHAPLARVLMMAGTNADVDALNAAAQAMRLHHGDLDPEAGHDYRIKGGVNLRLHIGDEVITRANDYEQDTGAILNGHRGIITAINADTGDLTVERIVGGADGPTPVETTVPEAYVRVGNLSLAYALTVHKAQGQTTNTALVSLTGLDAHAAYVALSRHRTHLHAWLPLAEQESDADRLRLGDARDPEELRDRAIAGYARSLARTEADPLAIADLNEYANHLLHRREHELVKFVGLVEIVDDQAGTAEGRTHVVAEIPVQAVSAWWERTAGALTDPELTDRIAAARRELAVLAERTAQAEANTAARTEHRRRDAEAKETEAQRRAAAVEAAHAGEGPAQDTERIRAQHARSALELLPGIRREHAAARALDEPLTAARAELRDIQQRLAQPGWRRALSGIRRATLTQQQAEAAAQLRGVHDAYTGHINARDAALAEARQHLVAAGAPHHEAHRDPIAATAKNLLDRHNTLLDIAREKDAAVADTPSPAYLQHVTYNRLRLPYPNATAPDPKRTDTVQARLDALVDEQTHRAGLPAGEAVTETLDRRRARTDARHALDHGRAPETGDPRQRAAQRLEARLDAEQQARQRAIEARATAEQQRKADDYDYWHHHRSGPDIDRGPSLGR